MTILQNAACIEIPVNPADKIVKFNSDILRNKKITSMYLFGSTEDVLLTSPNSDEFIAQIGEIDELSMFLNLIDNKGNHFIKDLSHLNITLNSESDNMPFIEYEINRILNLEESYFFYKTSNTPVKLLLYVFYQTSNFEKFTDLVTGSVTINIPITEEYQDIRLSEYVNHTLKGKKIRKIIATGRANGYLDIKGKNKTLENIPAHLFGFHSEKQFYLDAVEINYEKSTYKHRGNLPYENIKFTFIY